MGPSRNWEPDKRASRLRCPWCTIIASPRAMCEDLCRGWTSASRPGSRPSLASEKTTRAPPSALASAHAKVLSAAPRFKAVANPGTDEPDHRFFRGSRASLAGSSQVSPAARPHPRTPIDEASTRSSASRRVTPGRRNQVAISGFGAGEEFPSSRPAGNSRSVPGPRVSGNSWRVQQGRFTAPGNG
jgi:hypothetical protein